MLQCLERIGALTPDLRLANPYAPPVVPSEGLERRLGSDYPIPSHFGTCDYQNTKWF